MQGLTQPELLLKPFAQSGTKNTIPVTNTDSSNPQKADLTNGFPAITSLEPDDGGLPPERADINGLGYLTTTYDFFAQAGGKYTFNQTVAVAISGYPLNARLWYMDSNGITTILRSTKNDNYDDFVNNKTWNGSAWVNKSGIIGTTWVQDTPTMGTIEAIYPVGSIYIGTQATCPLSTLIVGSVWTKIEGRYLLASGTLVGTEETYSATNTVAAGLPDHNHSIDNGGSTNGDSPGSNFRWLATIPNAKTGTKITENASSSNPIYGSSTTNRPAAYVVNVWRRSA